MKKILSLVLLIVVLAGILSGCGKKKTNEIVVATYAGKYYDLIVKYVIAELQKTNPELTAVYLYGTDSDFYPKVMAEAGGPGTYDVVILGGNSMVNLQQNDLLMAIDESKVPNKKFIQQNFNNPYYVPQIYSALTLAYNETSVVPPPDSWKSLYDPKYKGRIGVMAAMRAQWLFSAIMADDADPMNTDWMSHFDSRILSLRDLDVKFYASNDALVSGLQSGEVWLSLGWRARNALLTVPGSEKLADVVPKEGTYTSWYGAGIPKNAKNPDGAHAFLNAMLAPEAQKGFGEEMGYSPTVTNVTLSPEMLAKIGFNDDEVKLIHTIPDEKFNEVDTVLIRRWEQEFVRE
jgi:putative spermidine/putrescine transport system substrate-binding protein